MPIRTKGKVYKTAVRPVLLYGSETWASTKIHERKLHVTEMRMLRWAGGVTLKDIVRNEHNVKRGGKVFGTSTIKKKTKEGGTGSARINSTWEYMDLMSFLSDAPERRVSRSEGISENDSQTSIRNTEVNTGIDFECDDTCTQEIYAENRPTTQENIGNTDNSTLGPSTSKKRKPIKLQEKLDKREIQRLNLLEALVNNTKNQSQVQPQSAIKKIFLSQWLKWWRRFRRVNKPPSERKFVS
ncbi:unnamed protein product [Parnassius apollo]|uniref:(apollo) hypothetical protein n=1 Tax=Parnassius apollo TaxID=110799 RepID=A0A8S3VXT7_PARAO|nr:unnamed protein product [Parnassius apollo]